MPVYESVAETLFDEPLVGSDIPFEEDIDAFMAALNSWLCATAPTHCPNNTYHLGALKTIGGRTSVHCQTSRPLAAQTFTTHCLKSRPLAVAWGTHAAFNICVEHANTRKTAATMADKLYHAEEKRRHLHQQWRDRRIYWQLRSSSNDEEASWIVIMADGADQAKFRIMKAARWPKDLDGEHRPKIKVVGALVHGHECAFNFVEEDVPKGANLTIEVIVGCLDRAVADSRRNRRPLATHLWIQMDNAGGEGKNQWLMRFWGLLVDRGCFRSCVLSLWDTHTKSMEIAKMLQWDCPQQMLEYPAALKVHAVLMQTV